MAESQATAPAKPSQAEFPQTDIDFQFLKEEPGLSSKSVQWIRKHRRLLTTLGAGIVLLTFVFREGVRENLKDFAETIERGNKVVKDRSPQQLPDFEVYKKIFEPLFNPATAVLSADEKEKISDGAYSLFQAVNSLEEQLQLNKEMAKFVGIEQSSAIDTAAYSIKVTSGQMGSFYVKIDTLVPLELFPNEPEGRVVQSHLSPDELKVVIDSIERSNKLNYDATRTVLFQAEREIVDTRWWYKVATWASYFLYTLGWGIGLIGKLVGLGGIDEN
jgi:hypothetical protein